MNSKKKKSVIIISLIVINAIFICGTFLLFYKINLKNKSISKIKEDIIFYEKRLENIKNIEKSLSDSEENGNAIKKVFLNKESIINFIERLEYLAKQTNVGLDMKSVNISSESSRVPVFSFSIRGSFTDIYDYLKFIESESYQITLAKAYFNKSEESSGWEASFDLELLSFQNDNGSN